MKALHLWSLAGTLAFLTPTLHGPKLHPVSASIVCRVNVTGSVGSVYVVQSAPDLAQSNSWTSLTFCNCRPRTIYSLIPQRQLEETVSIARCCKVPDEHGVHTS